MILWRPTRTSRTKTLKRCPFHYKGLECKTRKSRKIWSDRKIWLGVHKEAGKSLIEFCQENALVIQTPSSNNTREDSTHGHHQIINTQIRLIIFFAAKDGESLYSQQRQDWELTVTQIMNSILPNSDLNWRKQGKLQAVQVWPKSNPLWLYRGSDK